MNSGGFCAASSVSEDVLTNEVSLFQELSSTNTVPYVPTARTINVVSLLSTLKPDVSIEASGIFLRENAFQRGFMLKFLFTF